MLSRPQFLEVIKNTPLVAIDLIARNADGAVLVGMRKNEPAKGWWFVPGGRIYKDETLDAAFARISEAELGTTLLRGRARLLGVYEHIYPINVDNADFGTHYVVIGYEVQLDVNIAEAPFALQHEEAAWLSVADFLAHPTVHANTKAYFL
jgi:colanic acid biosynthesis protein WcaH